MKMKKQLLVGSLALIMLGSIFFGVTTQVHATAGVAGSFADSNPSEALDDTLVTFALDGLTTSSDYILVSTLLTNRTFSTGTGQTEKSVTVRISGTGSATVTLYGYNSSSGLAEGSALSTWEFAVTDSGEGDEVTNLYPLFIGVAIFSIIIGAIYTKRRG